TRGSMTQMIQSVIITMKCMQARAMTFLCIWQYYLSHEYRPPKIVYPDKKLVLKFRALIAFEVNCSATGDPQPIIKWTYNGIYIQPTLNTYVNLSTGALTFTFFRSEEVGIYRCIATNTAGRLTVSSMSPMVHLLEARLENFGQISLNITHAVNEYDYLRLDCDDTKSSVAPKLAYTWLDKHRVVIDSRSNRLFIDQRGNLHFTYLSVNDTYVQGYYCGIYMYVGIYRHTSVGTKRYLTVASMPNPKFAIAPKLRYSNSGVKALISSTAILECVFSGYDPVPPFLPVITWRNRAGEIYTNTTKYRVSQDGRRLIVKNVRITDEQAYFCQARNIAGIDSSSVSLDVTSGPVFAKGPPADQTVAPGANVSFQCDARSLRGEASPRNFVWYINSKPIAEQYDTNKFQFSPDNKMLTITRVNKDTDIMCVQCDISNDVDTVSASACLNIESISRADIYSPSSFWIVVYVTMAGICLLAFLLGLWAACNKRKVEESRDEYVYKDLRRKSEESLNTGMESDSVDEHVKESETLSTTRTSATTADI
ncbi:unnamed protein product, partial [Candidula unifasciata]